MSDQAPVTIEWLDETEYSGVEIPSTGTVELVAQTEVTAVAVDPTEFLEFHDGAMPGGSGGTSRYVFTQITPSATWTVSHNLNTRPSVMLFLDSTPDEPVYTDVTYPDLNTLVVEWPSPESGKAYI